MTGADRPAGRRPDPFVGPSAPSADPEQVLAQALHAMAGGSRNESPGPPAPLSPAPLSPMPTGGDDGRGWTVAQVVLLAALIGLTLGVAAGLLTLMLG